MFVQQIEINVQDIHRSLEFYTKAIGLRLLENTGNKASFTADGKTPLVIIKQPENVKPKQMRTTGLYHFALLVPNRKELGKVIQHLLDIGYPLQGASDHLVSEALYLSDPDGHGIEIYVDRPVDTWKWQDGEVDMNTVPMDVKAALAEAKHETWKGLSSETIMGHIHLHVAEIKQIKQFYCDVLGFDIANSLYGDQALFLSSGGYHHHIGVNTWNGVGAKAPEKDSVGLHDFTIVIPNNEKMKMIEANLKQAEIPFENKGACLITEDPSGNKIQLTILK